MQPCRTWRRELRRVLRFRSVLFALRRYAASRMARAARLQSDWRAVPGAGIVLAGSRTPVRQINCTHLKTHVFFRFPIFHVRHGLAAALSPARGCAPAARVRGVSVRAVRVWFVGACGVPGGLAAALRGLASASTSAGMLARFARISVARASLSSVVAAAAAAAADRAGDFGALAKTESGDGNEKGLAMCQASIEFGCGGRI